MRTSVLYSAGTIGTNAILQAMRSRDGLNDQSARVALSVMWPVVLPVVAMVLVDDVTQMVLYGRKRD